MLELERFVDNSMITQRSNQKTWRIEGEPVSAQPDGPSAGAIGSGTTPAGPKANKGGKKKTGGKSIADGKTTDKESKEAEAKKAMNKTIKEAWAAHGAAVTSLAQVNALKAVIQTEISWRHFNNDAATEHLGAMFGKVQALLQNAFWKPLALTNAKEWGEVTRASASLKQVQDDTAELKRTTEALSSEVDCRKAMQAIRRGK